MLVAVEEANDLEVLKFVEGEGREGGEGGWVGYQVEVDLDDLDSVLLEELVVELFHAVGFQVGLGRLEEFEEGEGGGGVGVRRGEPVVDQGLRERGRLQRL